MESFVDDLRKFEVTHQWWSPQTFQRLENQTLKTFVEETLSESTVAQTLLQSGSTDDFESFIAAIFEVAPKMITVVLACCLNHLYSIDSAEQPISQPIVAWYRQEGWNFPPFRHEEVQKIDEDVPARNVTNLLYDA